MRILQEGTDSFPDIPCAIVKIATTGCRAAEDEILEMTLLDARTRLDGPVMAPPLFFGRFRPVRHSDWPGARRRNGISPEDVRTAPSLDDPRERGRVQRILDSTGMLAGYNLSFILSFLDRHFRIPPGMRFVDIMQDWSRYAAGTGPDSRPMWLGMGDLFRTVRARGLAWRTSAGPAADRNTLGDAARLLFAVRKLRERGVRFSVRPLAYFLPSAVRPSAAAGEAGEAALTPAGAERSAQGRAAFSRSCALPVGIRVSAAVAATGAVTVRCGVDDPLHLLPEPAEACVAAPAGSSVSELCALAGKALSPWGRELSAIFLEEIRKAVAELNRDPAPLMTPALPGGLGARENLSENCPRPRGI